MSDLKPQIPEKRSLKSKSDGDTWEDRLVRACQTERETHQSYLDALGQGEVRRLDKLLACHAKAILSVSEAEQASIKVRRESGELGSREDFRAIILEILQPLRLMLDTLPKSESARCNPAQPELARKALEKWRDKVLERISGSEKKL